MISPLTSLELADALLSVIPKTMQGIRREVRKTAAPELSLTQFRVLWRLSEAAHTLSELSSEVGISLPVMSRQITSMEEMKWVKRIPSSTDRRSSLLSATTAGKQALLQSRQKIAESLSESVAALDPDQKQKLGAGLEILQMLSLDIRTAESSLS